MGITLISQSGTLGITLYDTISKMETVELSTLISVGNMAGLKFHDYINYANKDNNTDVILIYMEDVKDGKAFIKASKQCRKPIVVLKGGRSSVGAKAAASHTGALAGSDKIYQAAFKQAGVHLVDTIEEFIIAAEVFSMCNIPKGNKVGIVSPGGGANISCVDHCGGLEIPKFSDSLQSIIKLYMPSHAAKPVNPVDLAASFAFDDYEQIIYEIAFNDINEVDILISNMVMTDGYIDEWNKSIISKFIYKNSPIPIIGSWMGTEGKSKDEFKKLIPVFNEPAKAAWAANLLVKEKEFQEM